MRILTKDEVSKSRRILQVTSVLEAVKKKDAQYSIHEIMKKQKRLSKKIDKLFRANRNLQSRTDAVRSSNYNLRTNVRKLVQIVKMICDDLDNVQANNRNMKKKIKVSWKKVGKTLVCFNNRDFHRQL